MHFILGKSTTLRRPLVDGLRLVADSLTHLDIHGNSSIQLRDILESCPNLECLLTTYVDAVTPSSPSTRYPKMKRLALHSLSDTDITHHNMIDVLSRFPSLLSLEVNRVPECSVLRILHEHCPYLKILCLGVTYSPYDEMNVQPNRKGITWAYLAGRVGDVYMQDDLIMFLDQHKKSLEMIIIDARIKANNPGFQLSNGEIVEAGDYDPLAASTAPVVVEEDGTSDTLFTR